MELGAARVAYAVHRPWTALIGERAVVWGVPVTGGDDEIEAGGRGELIDAAGDRVPSGTGEGASIGEVALTSSRVFKVLIAYRAIVPPGFAPQLKRQLLEPGPWLFGGLMGAVAVAGGGLLALTTKHPGAERNAVPAPLGAAPSPAQPAPPSQEPTDAPSDPAAVPAVRVWHGSLTLRATRRASARHAEPAC